MMAPSDQTPSGQQAVEPVLSAAETADRLEAWAREMLASTPPKTGALHLLDAVHYLRTAAPTAPSTAAGEKTSAVKQMERSPERWANMSPDVVADGSRAQVAYALEDAQHDIALLVAALATPPAPTVPWQEQAAQQCEAWAKAHRSTDMELFCRIFADDFRALARSEKGEGK